MKNITPTKKTVKKRKDPRNFAETDLPQIILKSGEACCTSLVVAKYFKRRHDDVLKAIANLECSNEFRLRNFAESNYLNEQDRPQKMFIMNRDGAMFLIMGLTGEKAAKCKEAFIEAFNLMESLLREKQSKEWDDARSKGKLYHREFTDSLKLLQEHAVKQGSETYAKRPELLYANYTKAIYRIYPELKDIKGVREHMTSSQLICVASLGHMVSNLIKNQVKGNLSYKQIYQECKYYADEYKSLIAKAMHPILDGEKKD